MTEQQQRILEALYEREGQSLQLSQFEVWTTPAMLAADLNEDESTIREVLESLWLGRKVIQIPDSDGSCEFENVQLDEANAFDEVSSTLPRESNDCRNLSASEVEDAALYGSEVAVKYRSRVAEIARLLNWNYQRFRMAPGTGMLRYLRRSQSRPLYDVSIRNLRDELCQAIQAGEVPIANESHALSSEVHRELLCRAIEAVLESLHELFVSRGRDGMLARFQADSLRTTLAGLYCPSWQESRSGHVVTAGVGSGKTFAFQLGALIHVAYQAMRGERKIQVLMLYPRVVLAVNQFQDLKSLVQSVSERLQIKLNDPILDAGGQLASQLGIDSQESGSTFRAITEAYNGEYQILISNLDSLANRLSHPQACRGLTENLDLIVLDEVHLLSGLYGAHARMLLRRILLMRELWQLRSQNPSMSFRELLNQKPESRLWFIGASATIAEPCNHVGRLLSLPADQLVHLDVGETVETGWVHHLFLRQRPEISNMSAVTNATSCLIHNRRNGLFREYYQRKADENGRFPLTLTDLSNPVIPSETVELRETKQIHKTLGFCDSLDGVGRWTYFVGDNERTRSLGSSASPSQSSSPYYLRFQEPLWRAIHHQTFGQEVPKWHALIWEHYGSLCHDCKRGCRSQIPRIPPGLKKKQEQAVRRLWDFTSDNGDSYLRQLGVDEELIAAEWWEPLRQAAQSSTLENLDGCAFFQSGLCWWFSMDHIGSNHPQPVSPADPLNGFKMPRQHASNPYNHLNAIRVRAFTSKTDFNAFSASSINDLFRGRSGQLFHAMDYDISDEENCVFVIGSPRIEVGIDLDRASEGITYRALRDPASVQQKAGRVGRELNADSMVVHLVTENARDHYYFRNPEIALDASYLQPIPLHENNRIVARNHYFMSIVDFLSLQAANPDGQRIADAGDRLALINDHHFGTGNQSFRNWDKKVEAVYDFIFGGHAHQQSNFDALCGYLQRLGAEPEEITNPDVTLTPDDSPMNHPVGAVDVFRHDFGPNLLLTPLQGPRGPFTLAQLAASTYNQPPPVNAAPERHRQFIAEYVTYNKPHDHAPSAYRDRGYLRQLLTLPIFRRGNSVQNRPGNLPWLWTPNLFEAVGNETVRVFEQRQEGTRNREPESVSLALALLVPGTFTYRYRDSALKVPVDSCGAQGLTPLQPRLEGVVLNVSDPEYYQPAPCDPVDPNDFPDDFVHDGQPVKVYVPQQVGLIWVPNEPQATQDGLVADGDARPQEQGIYNLPTPPRTFPLRWYRVSLSEDAGEIPCRAHTRYRQPGGEPIPRQSRPPVFSIFNSVRYDPSLNITEMVWGLDQQFTTRKVDPARLVYREGGDSPSMRSIALGRHFSAPGIWFDIDLSPDSEIGRFLEQTWQQTHSIVHQSLLIQTLNAFLNEHATNPPSEEDPPWMPPSRPSLFTMRNLRSIVLFHLLRCWHPSVDSEQTPSQPPRLDLESIRGCFTPGHANFLDENGFTQTCRLLAQCQNPTSVDDRARTLSDCYPNFQAACECVESLNQDLFQKTARKILLNSLGLSIHVAALRLTGAEDSNLSYFCRETDDQKAFICLFDSDDLGNGTVDVVRDHFFVSPLERRIQSEMKARGLNPDPLPTNDFAFCFEEQLMECPASQAGQTAYHNCSTDVPWLQDLTLASHGESRIAQPVYDFIRDRLACPSRDHALIFQYCPEFLVHLGTWSIYADDALVPSPRYPTFQALESAVGFCAHGCVECLVSPEQNLHGPLQARETVNKPLLDALYRELVCLRESASDSYPASGVGRTCDFTEVEQALASTPTMESIVIDIPGGPLTVNDAMIARHWQRVFRPDWSEASQPGSSVRPWRTV